jgi:hypothetical protein
VSSVSKIFFFFVRFNHNFFITRITRIITRVFLNICTCKCLIWRKSQHALFIKIGIFGILRRNFALGIFRLFTQCFPSHSCNLLIAPEKKERARIQLNLGVEMLAYSSQLQIRQSWPNPAYSSQQQIPFFPSRPLWVKKERKEGRLDSEKSVACLAAALAWMGTSLAGMGTSLVGIGTSLAGMGTSLAKLATSFVALTGSFAR